MKIIIQCAFLDKNELCSIYETRPECCRSFPNRNSGMFCSNSKCDLDCKNCIDKCCKNIYLENKNDDVISALSINCENCSKNK